MCVYVFEMIIDYIVGCEDKKIRRQGLSQSMHYSIIFSGDNTI